MTLRRAQNIFMPKDIRTAKKGLSRELHYSWNSIEKLVKDKQGWKDLVAALMCSTGMMGSN